MSTQDQKPEEFAYIHSSASYTCVCVYVHVCIYVYIFSLSSHSCICILLVMSPQTSLNIHTHEKEEAGICFRYPYYLQYTANIADPQKVSVPSECVWALADRAGSIMTVQTNGDINTSCKYSTCHWVLFVCADHKFSWYYTRLSLTYASGLQSVHQYRLRTPVLPQMYLDIWECLQLKKRFQVFLDSCEI